MIDTGPDPLTGFNEFSDEDKLNFCQKYINYSVMLFEDKIDFDPTRLERIIRKETIVQYKNPFLHEFEDTLNIIICPCIDTSDSLFELGVLPIRYKYEHLFPYAFIYDILKSADTDKSSCITNVRVLTKVDIKGLAKKRDKWDREQQKRREKKRKKEEKKAKQEEDDNENSGGGFKILTKALSFL